MLFFWRMLALNLRGHLDDDTMRKLSVMATPVKQPHRDASKVKKNPEPRVLELPADERRRLAKTKSQIERRERRKTQRTTSPKAKKQAKPTSKGLGEPPKRPRKSAAMSAEGRKLNGLPASNGGPSRVRLPKRDPLLDVMPSPAPSKTVRGPVPQPMFTLTHRKPFRPKPTDRVRCGAVRSQLKLKEKQVLELIAELSVTVRRGGSGDYIMGSDYERLRRHVEQQRKEPPVVEELSFEQKLLRTRGANQWQSEGTPLARYESKKAPRIKPTPKRTSDSVPFVRVVSGGLPTLGKGRK